MLWRKSPVILLLTLALAVLLAAPGCWNPFDPEPGGDDGDPVEPVDRESKVNLVKFFARAHRDRDLAAYDESLHQNYEFWFSEDDREDPGWDWLDWIPKITDVEITERMFTAEKVSNISATFTNVTNVPAADDPEDNFWELTVPQEPPDSPFTVYWADFLVDMHVVEEGEETVDHWVDGRAYMYFIPDPQFEGKWQVWKVEDKGNVHKKGPMSWGSLKREMRGNAPGS